ncbi:MAG: hypothetical protein ACE5F1_10650 [Planctomycetota bacterium]
MCRFAWLAFLPLLVAGESLAQIGGSGRDGPLAPTSDFGLDTSKNHGVFQFTRIDIPKGVTVSIRGPNPAILHSQGEVKIAGRISLDAPGAGYSGNAGPGGFGGGKGTTYLFLPGEDGKGPGGGKGGYISRNGGHPSGGPGGHATPGKYATKFNWLIWGPGPANGSAFPFTLWGGSGGGGAVGSSSTGKRPWGPYGGGGGGVLVVLADGAISVTGSISANGGDTMTITSTPWGIHAGGPGAGGSILLRSMRSVVVESGARIHSLGGRLLHYLYLFDRFGGEGFVRLDSYATPPVVRGQLGGKSLELELPFLAEFLPPRVGKDFGLACAAVPGDIVGVFLSKRGAKIPLPPFGVLRLDPYAGMIYLGGIIVPDGGHDPIGLSLFRMHSDPGLNGLGLHVQGINLITKSGRPRLTNSVITQVRM